MRRADPREGRPESLCEEQRKKVGFCLVLFRHLVSFRPACLATEPPSLGSVRRTIPHSGGFLKNGWILIGVCWNSDLGIPFTDCLTLHYSFSKMGKEEEEEEEP